MKINIVSSSRYKIERKKIRKVVSEILEKNKLTNWTVNLIFVGKTKMRQIAKKYKKENVALPVLSFPYAEKIGEENLLGEIYICYPQVVLLAAEKEKTVLEMMKKILEHGLNNLISSDVLS